MHDSDLDSEGDLLAVEVVRSGGACHIVLRGDLDFATAGRVRDALDEAFAAAPAVAALDLRGLEFIDVTGIKAVVEFARRARLHAVPHTIIRAGAVVQRAFDLIGVTATLPFVDDVDGPPLPATT